MLACCLRVSFNTQHHLIKRQTVIKNPVGRTNPLTYKLLYIVAEEVGQKTKGLSGVLTLHGDRAHIEGPEELSLPYSQFEALRIFRQHKVGTLIHVRCGGISAFLAVPRINLFGIFAVINYFKTNALFDELQRRSNAGT